jgi:hypothetical protein
MFMFPIPFVIFILLDSSSIYFAAAISSAFSIAAVEDELFFFTSTATAIALTLALAKDEVVGFFCCWC